MLMFGDASCSVSSYLTAELRQQKGSVEQHSEAGAIGLESGAL